MLIIFSFITALICIPMVSAILILIFRKKSMVRDSISIVVSLIALVLIVFFIIRFNGLNVDITTFKLFKITNEIYFSLQIESLSLVFALLVCILWPFTIFYSISYMHKRREKHQTNFLFFLHMSLFATFGIAFSGNLFTTFIFYEALTLLTYPLVTHTGTIESKKAGRIYLGVLIGTSMLFFLPAIIITYSTANSITYTRGGLPFSLNPNLIAPLLLLFLLGISKIAIMPFHKWLPKAMVAPVPASALLHAVAVVKSGVFIVIKIIVYIFGVNNLHNIMVNNYAFNWFLLLPLITIVLSSLINLFEVNLKKILAYSTISQLSYILLCILLFNKTGVIAAILYLIAHSFAKIVLFFTVGAIIIFLGKENLEGVKGSASSLPVIMLSFGVAISSIIGLPFTAGFIAKYYLFNALISSQSYFVFPVLIISSCCIAFYFFRIIYNAFFMEYKGGNITIDLTNKATLVNLSIITVVIVMLVLINILVFAFSPLIVNFITPITNNL